MLLASGEIEAALAEAKSDLPSSFEASQQELLGDIYQAQSNNEAAVKAYNNAWSLLSARNETRAVLALKMESLGIYPEPIESKSTLIQQPAAPQGLALDNTIESNKGGVATGETTNNSNDSE